MQSSFRAAIFGGAKRRACGRGIDMPHSFHDTPRMPSPRTCFAFAACCLALCTWSTHAQAEARQTILYYDPDANYDAIPRIVESLNLYLSEQLPGYVIQMTSDPATTTETIKSGRVAYAILGADFVESSKSLGVSPLLVPQYKGSVYYNKLLVDRGNGAPGDLRGKRIAAATGDSRAGVADRVLDLLKRAGLQVDDAVFLGTSKDLDALLAVIFGQADAALITSNSLNTLKLVNPAAAKTMRSVWTSGNILRPLLVAIRGNDHGIKREEVMKAFSSIPDNPTGRSAMQAMGYDKWIAYTPQLSTAGAQK